MQNTIDTSFKQKNTADEQIIYNHLLECVEVETPTQLIERFRTLLFEGYSYPDRTITTTLEKILASKQAEQEFKHILNRCCYILINRWQMHTQQHSAIRQLIELFETNSGNSNIYSYNPRGQRRIQQLVQQFSQSEQYHALYRLVQVINPSESPASTTKPLGTLISCYPYLYEHCLLSDGSSYEQQQIVRKIQASRQKQYEINLSQYVTYQVRRSQLVRRGEGNSRLIQPVKNPTLLNDRELYGALKQFVGKVEGGNSYRHLAQSFLTHTSHAPSYGVFKDELYDYLISSVNYAYGKRQFNDRLYKQIHNTLPQSDNQKLSDFLIVRTCSQLLNFLVIENGQRPHHYILIDLISNLGPTSTVGLLLKIVLLCRQVKPYLERRFALLFNHYETSSRETVKWLIKGLENLNIALSTNFGAVDLSFLR